MKEETRTNNAIKNTSITMLCHIIYLICTFVCRTVFTNTLGAEYLGIGGLFSNILTILSFAELGLGSALVYHLYKPFAENNYEKIAAYTKLYKKIYRVIILIILCVGLLITPFLNYLVEAPEVKESLVLLYFLYLTHTLTSYMFVYKKSLLTANQKDYIVTLFTEITNVVMYIVQCILLIIYKNFVIYCILTIVFCVINNLLCSLYADKRYNEINKYKDAKLTKNEVDTLKKDAKGLLMTKVASTAFSGTDNIFISSFIGIKYVGILSNYTIILTTVNAMMNKIFSSITASIGNLAVNKDSNNKTEGVLSKLYFANASIYSLICVGMMLLIGEFVTKIWFNDTYFLSVTIVILAVIELYLRSLHYPIYTMRNAMGLFSQYRIIFVGSAILNIILDFILVKPFGIAGLIIATIICRGITYITDIYVVYKMGFKSNQTPYYLMVGKWLLFTAVTYLLSFLIIKNITEVNILNFALKCIVAVIVYFICYLVSFMRTEEFKYFKNLFIKKIFKIKRGA